MYWSDLNVESYQEYLETTHWRQLKDRLIHESLDAHCCLCGRNRYLVLHHLSYKKLGEERPFKYFWGDIVITCMDCHELLHFYYIGSHRFKIPLKHFWLRKRYFYLLIKRGFNDSDILGVIWGLLLFVAF